MQHIIADNLTRSCALRYIAASRHIDHTDNGIAIAKRQANDSYTVTYRYYDGGYREEYYDFGQILNEVTGFNQAYNVWISPIGQIYYVFYHGHHLFAQYNYGVTAKELVSLGWTHISYGLLHESSRRLNRSQQIAGYKLAVALNSSYLRQRIGI